MQPCSSSLQTNCFYYLTVSFKWLSGFCTHVMQQVCNKSDALLVTDTFFLSNIQFEFLNTFTTTGNGLCYL